MHPQTHTLALPSGQRMAWSVTGDRGPVMILCHPATGNLLSWEGQRQVFAAAGFRVITCSRPGFHGAPLQEDMPPGTQADDLLALLDHLAAERAFVVGVAAGGMAALDLALSAPARLAGAVVASSLMGIPEADYLALCDRLRGGWFDSLPPEVQELGPSCRALDPGSVAEWNRIRVLNAGYPPRQPMRTAPTWAALAANRVPLLLMTGDADLYMPPALLRLVAGRTGQARAAVVADAGHAMHHEQPDRFNTAVLDFLREG